MAHLAQRLLPHLDGPRAEVALVVERPHPRMRVELGLRRGVIASEAVSRESRGSVRRGERSQVSVVVSK